MLYTFEWFGNNFSINAFVIFVDIYYFNERHVKFRESFAE